MPGLVLTLLLASALPADGALTADPAASTIRYTIIHKLHEVHATTHDLEGKAVVRPDGTVLAMVRVPVVSFRSGDGNRDAHMLEAVEAGKFPFVVVKGLAQLGAARELPAAPVALNGEVELHGVKSSIAVPVSVSVQPDGTLRARGNFAVSLDAHRVERPSLLFVKIEDACRIEFDLVLRSER